MDSLLRFESHIKLIQRGANERQTTWHARCWWILCSSNDRIHFSGARIRALRDVHLAKISAWCGHCCWRPLGGRIVTCRSAGYRRCSRRHDIRRWRLSHRCRTRLVAGSDILHWFRTGSVEPFRIGPPSVGIIRSITLVMCDEVAWEFLTLSMASWNALWSAALVGLWLLAFARERHSRQAQITYSAT